MADQTLAFHIRSDAETNAFDQTRVAIEKADTAAQHLQTTLEKNEQGIGSLDGMRAQAEAFKAKIAAWEKGGGNAGPSDAGGIAGAGELGDALKNWGGKIGIAAAAVEVLTTIFKDAASADPDLAQKWQNLGSFTGQLKEAVGQTLKEWGVTNDVTKGFNFVVEKLGLTGLTLGNTKEPLDKFIQTTPHTTTAMEKLKDAASAAADQLLNQSRDGKVLSDERNRQLETELQRIEADRKTKQHEVDQSDLTDVQKVRTKMEIDAASDAQKNRIKEQQRSEKKDEADTGLRAAKESERLAAEQAALAAKEDADAKTRLSKADAADADLRSKQNRGKFVSDQQREQVQKEITDAEQNAEKKKKANEDALKQQRAAHDATLEAQRKQTDTDNANAHDRERERIAQDAQRKQAQTDLYHAQRKETADKQKEAEKGLKDTEDRNAREVKQSTDEANRAADLGSKRDAAQRQYNEAHAAFEKARSDLLQRRNRGEELSAADQDHFNELGKKEAEAQERLNKAKSEAADAYSKLNSDQLQEQKDSDKFNAEVDAENQKIDTQQRAAQTGGNRQNDDDASRVVQKGVEQALANDRQNHLNRQQLNGGNGGASFINGSSGDEENPRGRNRNAGSGSSPESEAAKSPESQQLESLMKSLSSIFQGGPQDQAHAANGALNQLLAAIENSTGQQKMFYESLYQRARVTTRFLDRHATTMRTLNAWRRRDLESSTGLGY